MAVKPENTFRAGVHKHLPKTLHHEKMNNPYSSGTADDWYSGNCKDLWIEYKYITRVPSRVNVRPAEMLSPLQLRWLNGRHSEGRNIAVVVGCPDGGVILRNQEWEMEMNPDTFRDRLVPRQAIAQWIVEATTR